MRFAIAYQYLGTPTFHAYCLVLASAAAIEAFVAVWAADSRRHWSCRGIAVWTAVMALAPIRAYEPALIFALSSPLTIVLILLQRMSRRRGIALGGGDELLY